MTNKTHDIAVIGAGPAGLTAAIYAARGKYDILIIEKAVVGGTALMIDNLENFSGQAIKAGDTAVLSVVIVLKSNVELVIGQVWRGHSCSGSSVLEPGK